MEGGKVVGTRDGKFCRPGMSSAKSFHVTLSCPGGRARTSLVRVSSSLDVEEEYSGKRTAVRSGERGGGKGGRHTCRAISPFSSFSPSCSRL